MNRRSGFCAFLRRVAVLLVCAGLLPAGALAFEGSGEQFVFPYEGFRFDAPAQARVLTQHNLADHAEFLASLGTDVTAMQAGLRSGSIVLTVYPEQGGQLELSMASAASIAGAEGARPGAMDAAVHDALRAAYAGMPRYQELDFSPEQPDWLRMVFSAQHADQAVFTLRYVTLAHGQQYMVSSVLIGRAPEAEDDALVLDFIRRLEFLAARTTPEPTATPEPTPAPSPTPKPTPGVAEEAERLEGEGVQLTVNAPPAWTDQSALNITGTADPDATVRLLLGERVLDKVVVAEDGIFSLDGQLPEGGDLTLTVESAAKGGGVSKISYAVRYDMPKLPLTITSPLEPIRRKEETVRGITQPGAKIDIRGGGLVVNVRANAKGEFSFRIKAEEEGDTTYTLTASLKDYETVKVEHTVTRIMNEQEALNAFRRSLINMDYKRLLSDPQKYEGKNVGYRGRIRQIGDMDGAPCLLLESKNTGGAWGEPVWVVCDELPPYPVDTIITAYVECTGQLAAYTDARGREKELPVMRLHFYAK